MNSAVLMRVRHIERVFFCFSVLKINYRGTAVEGVGEDILLLLEPRRGIFENAIIFGLDKVGGAYEDKRFFTADLLYKFG